VFARLQPWLSRAHNICTATDRSRPAVAHRNERIATVKLKVIHILFAVGLLPSLAAPSSDAAAAPAQVEAPPPRAPASPPPAQARRAKLALTKRAAKRVVRAGTVARFTLAVTDRTIVAARAVKVCDRVPARSQLVSASRRVELKGRNACFKLGTFGPGETVTIMVSLRVQGNARGKLRNTATATARNAHATRAQATVRIAPTHLRTRVTEYEHRFVWR
jgi:uncharacterized repeat protein (TIGR01451 family)